ncbi:hypothetical protein ACQ4M5_22560 [Leptolyngbya sp. AN10]
MIYTKSDLDQMNDRQLQAIAAKTGADQLAQCGETGEDLIPLILVAQMSDEEFDALALTEQSLSSV